MKMVITDVLDVLKALFLNLMRKDDVFLVIRLENIVLCVIVRDVLVAINQQMVTWLMITDTVTMAKVRIAKTLIQ